MCRRSAGDRGEEADRFASIPDYFEEDPEAAAVLRQQWASNPATVAATTGCSVEQVTPYLVHLSEEDLEQGMGKAFPDDEFDLDDIWVFTDIWRRLGIRYPDPADPVAAGVELAPGGKDRLPGSREWSL